MILKVLKRLAYLLVGLSSLSLIGLQAYKIILRIATRIEAPNGISSLEEIELGGQRQWIFIRGEDRNNPNGGVMRNVGFEQMTAMLGFLTSPEYSLSEGLNAMRLKGMDFTISALWDEMEDIDLAEEIRSIEVPIYFFEGKFDMANPTVIVEDFYNSLEDREDIHLVIFEGSAHLPMIEEREKYEDLLVSVALKESQGESPNSEGVSYVRP